VFTKYDQFLRNVKIHLEDYGSPYDDVSDVAEKQFQEHYLQPLGDTSGRHVRLESGCRVRQVPTLCANVPWQKCTEILVAAMTLSRRRLYR
jgi:hypothetical protein